jgi:LPS-assembly lipoprotein
MAPAFFSTRQSAATGCLCLILVLTLTGCGFQLREALSVPDAIQPLAVNCASPIPERLCRSVENQLALGEVSTTSPDKAAAILELSNFRQDRRANAITARAGAAEYTLRQSIDLEVISAKQTPILARVNVTSAETYRYDETNVLAKRLEEEALQEQLADRLAQQILFRLAPLNRTRLETLEADE